MKKKKYIGEIVQSRIVIIERAVMSSSIPSFSSLAVAVRNCDECSSSSPEKFQEFLDYLVNAYHRHFLFSTATEWKTRKLMRRLHEKLFSDGSEKGKSTKSNDDDRKEDDKEKRKDERMIERLANDSIMILKKAVGKDWTADALAEKLLTEYKCGAELASSMHEIFSKHKEKLERSFARGTFGIVKRLESVCWRTQVELYDSNSNDTTGKETRDEVTAVLELRMEKNETTSIEFKKEELLTFFKELETIQMKIDDLH